MPLDPADIRKIAEGYTEAWCSRSAEAVASFFAENATSVINAGPPTVGRPAIAEAMGAFFADFPDLVLHMESVNQGDGQNARVWRTYNDGRVIAKDASGALDHFEPADWAVVFTKILGNKRKDDR